MSTFSKQLVIPETLQVEDKTKTDNYAKFTAEPYEKGYGHTIGNSLRRILLSSLEGAAVVAVRIKGARHEYAAVNGVQEDVVNIVLNLKKLRVRLKGEGPETLLISLKGKKTVTAADINENANVEIINKDLVIAHVESGAEFEAELEIARGSGYLTSEEIRARVNLPMEFIPMDAIFSPVQKVHYTVENARVGQRTDYDKLVLEIWTDGTTTPSEAVSNTAALLRRSIMPFLPAEEAAKEPARAQEAKKEPAGETSGKLEQGVEMIELSSRASNCLKVAGIRTIGELVRKSEGDLLAVKNFGQKSLDEIKEKLKEMGLDLGMKID
ncbi:MAG TPA: DNA-directed RNA polymerase subunit alpha [Elusimicrobia bacterium]|jgi:DNA-directed RNA polymerase subunit alpha|nr:MAG: DNA-directed RNA polymerase subunit alpha [Elusimicrobia bacterium GWA2_64_40]OGR68094.1 MAG: DNA-directed RNA polymerase subunit alpha [Elusimicrobia bacterium GWB2_63_16]HAN05888.1 DNA-directed RNA polymerase subunit alpha [Elusimicrobiota bacterium]HAU89361.1 DNA-directed RNA polymerase subunit alpha [Elusimicrobiota bacterium]